MTSKNGKRLSTGKAFRLKTTVRTNHCSDCSKVLFLDELSAKIALAQRKYKGKGEVRVYPCPKGYGWHLTSKRN